MCYHTQALLSFSKIRNGWELCATDSLGISVGLLSTWDPTVVHCKAFVSPYGILVRAVLRNQPLELSYLNSYGPYINRTLFSKAVVNEGSFYHANLIIAGDIKFNLLDAEIWVQNVHIDPLSTYFIRLLVSTNLVDIPPTCIIPTQRNGRSSDKGISKRLDRFLVSESLVPLFSCYCSWVHHLVISDHHIL